MALNLTIGTAPAIPVNTLTDLENAVDTALQLGPEFQASLGGQLSQVPDKLTTSIAYTSGNPSWQLGDFGFTLSGSATGSVTVIKGPNLLTYTDGLATEVTIGLNPADNSDYSKSLPVPAGFAYVCIEFDFQIQGGISAKYTSGVYGVSGSVNANDKFTVAFYKQCPLTDTLGNAVVTAFSDFVLPLHDSTLQKLKVGDYLHHTFNANLQVGLGASIGIDQVLYAGQSTVDLPNTGNAVGVKASMNSKAQVGANLAFSFDYAGTFEALLWVDAQAGGQKQGHLHLYRSKVQDSSLGLTLGITATLNPTASANVVSAQLGTLLAGSLPSSLGTALQNTVLPKAESELDTYVQEVNSKISGWLQPFNQVQATLDIAIQKSNQAFLLLDYTFDFNAPEFAAAWSVACNGRFVDALSTPQGGVSIAVGSGLEKFYSDKTSISLNLFGKLTATWTSAIIETSSIVYAGNNIFHLIANEGRQLLSSVNNSKKEIDLYFASEADLTGGVLSLRPPNLHVILQATNNKSFGGYIASFLGLISTGTSSAALTKSVNALAAEANTTQLLHLVFGPTLYGNLNSSTTVAGNLNNEAQDRTNYSQFARACGKLDLDSPASFSVQNRNLDYGLWSGWNNACRGAQANAIPNRRDPGSFSSGWPYLDGQFPNANSSEAPLIGYTLGAAGDFMNFCEDLKNLGQIVPAAQVLTSWDNLVDELTSIIHSDVSQDFIAPATLALTWLLSNGTPTLVTGPAPGLTDKNSVGVTVTYS